MYNNRKPGILLPRTLSTSECTGVT